jgi:hypothetical protein
MRTWWIVKDSRHYAPEKAPSLDYWGPYETPVEAERAQAAFLDDDTVILCLEVPDPEPERDPNGPAAKDRQIEELLHANHAYRRELDDRIRRNHEQAKELRALHQQEIANLRQLHQNQVGEIVSLNQIINKQEDELHDLTGELERLVEKLRKGGGA